MTKRAISSPLRLRAQVNTLLSQWGSGKATKFEWGLYSDEGWDADTIADRIRTDRRNGLRISTEPEGAALTDGPDLAAWITARTLLIKRKADSDPDLKVWRDKHLADGLMLDPKSVQQWITEQAEAAGRATGFVSVEVPADWKWGDPVPADGQQAGYSVRPLPYVVVEDRLIDNKRYEGSYVHYVGTVTGTALDELRVLGEHLADAHGWNAATATTYVLTGIAPTPKLLSVDVKHSWPKGEVPRQLITITADPDIPVEEVAAAFRAERQKLRGARARLPKAKVSRLVAYWAQHQPLSTRKLWKGWNAEHPDDQYSDLRAIRQAYQDGERRVLGQPRPPRAS